MPRQSKSTSRRLSSPPPPSRSSSGDSLTPSPPPKPKLPKSAMKRPAAPPSRLSSESSEEEETTTPSPPHIRSAIKHPRHSRTSLPTKLNPADLTTEQVSEILKFWTTKGNKRLVGEREKKVKVRDESEERAFELSDIDEDEEDLNRKGEELAHRLLEPFQNYEHDAVRSEAADTTRIMQVLQDCMVPFDDTALQTQCQLWFDTGAKAVEKARKVWHDELKQGKIHCDRIQDILDQMEVIEADNVAANEEAQAEYEKIFMAQEADIDRFKEESQSLQNKYTVKMAKLMDPAYKKKETNKMFQAYFNQA